MERPANFDGSAVAVLKQIDFDETKFLDSIICYEENKAISKSFDTVNICFNIDSNFFMPLGVAITSVLENNRDMNFNFHVFVDEAFDGDLQKLRKTMAHYKQNAYVYIMRPEPFADFHVKHARFKRVSYFRLYIPKLLKKITRKYIYIDADLICVSSMKPFVELDLEGKALGAVSEYPKDVEYRSDFLKLKSGKYFNSGCLVVDTEEWEKRNITEKCFSYAGKDPALFSCHDQDILNLVFDGDFKPLDRKFNYLLKDSSLAPEGCIIYHFYGRTKPWHLALNNYEKKWRHYCELSEWPTISDPLPPANPENYADFKYASRFYFSSGNYFAGIRCFLLYSRLKFRFRKMSRGRY